MTTQTKPRFKGYPITLGDTEFTVPAMSCGIVEEFESRIADLQAGADKRPLPLIADLLHRCLQRNYPDLQRQLCADFVDLDNWEETFAKMLGQSGFVQWQEMQEADPGNGAATTESPGTGTPSTPTLPPVSDTPSSTAETS